MKKRTIHTLIMITFVIILSSCQEANGTPDVMNEAVEEKNETVEILNETVDETNEMTEEPNEIAEEPNEIAEEPNETAEEPNETAEEPNEKAEEPNEKAEEADGLDGALLYLPERENYVIIYFTDWVRLNEVNGTSPFNWGGLGDQWMWTEADLDWAAEIVLDRGGAPIRIINFRNDFDLDPIFATFMERGFSRVDTDQTTTFTHEFDLTVNPPILSYANTILIPEAKVMMFTSGGGIEDLSQILDFYSNPDPSSSLSGTPTGDCFVQGLGDSAEGFIDMKTCTLMNR